jgi:DNA-binding GntR family transcriptional regulator
MSSEVRPPGPAPSNVDLALEAVRDAIVTGRLRPGERIKEIPLAQELGFSRAPVRDALRLLERDGLVELVPNRGAIVPALRAVDVLEVYALRAALGTLALHKLMLDAESLATGTLERELARLVRAGERRRARDAADADLAYQQAIVTAAELPRVSREFERLTWQVRMFLGALEIDVLDNLERIITEVQGLHEAILARDVQAAERLWREKFERWISDLVGRLEEDFDRDLWVALTRGAGDPTGRAIHERHSSLLNGS